MRLQEQEAAMLETERVSVGRVQLEKQENRQVEEILRLEREIEELQRQKEQQESALTEDSLTRLQRLRDQELGRLEEEACRAAHEFLRSLNFQEIDECVRDIESALAAPAEGGPAGKPTFNFSQPYPEEDAGEGAGEEEEEDEGFDADDDAAFKDSPNPSEHGHSDQRTSGIRTSDDSSEEDPYMNDGLAPSITSTEGPAPDITVTNTSKPTHDDYTYCLPEQVGTLTKST